MEKTFKTYRSGEIFTPDAGEYEEFHCVICDAKMDVERNVNGPRGRIAAMAGINELHDVFTCPNAGKDWHVQIIALHQAAKETPSKIFEDQLLEEADNIKKTQVATKKVVF